MCGSKPRASAFLVRLCTIAAVRERSWPVCRGFGDVAGDLTGIFVFFAGDGAEVGVWAAFYVQWTGLTGPLQCAVFGNTFAVEAAIGIGMVSSELFACRAFRTDVLVIVGVPFKIGPRPGAVGAPGFVQHRNVGIDLLPSTSTMTL